MAILDVPSPRIQKEIIMKKQISIKIDADIVRWFKKEKHHDINTILKGHIKLVEAQRKAAGTPDPHFIPNPKPEKKKKGRK